ncbi:MAG: phage integrase N-terminal SAM-like domain-containing protein [Candidatus Neomarinimicrobiota bacterium]
MRIANTCFKRIFQVMGIYFNEVIKMASLKKRREMWYARVRIWNGFRQIEKQIPLRTKSKTEARVRLSEVEKLENDIKKGTEFSFAWLSGESRTKVVHFKIFEAVKMWLKSREQNNIRQATIRINKVAISHLIEMLGREYPVERITIGDIERFKEWSFDHKHHSVTTVNIYLRSINTFFGWLVDNERIKSRPKIKQIKEDDPEVKYLTEGEIADLFRLDLSQPVELTNGKKTWVRDWEHYKTAFWFYLNTGCRLREPFLGEINGIWLDIPPHQSKNHKARNIELDAKKLQILEEMRERVFSSSNLKYATDRYNKVFRKACDILEIKNRSLHSLRHTYACIRRLETNGNILLMRDELGHRTVITTERYCNIPLNRLKDDFPSYSKLSKIGIRDTEFRDTESQSVNISDSFIDGKLGRSSG